MHALHVYRDYLDHEQVKIGDHVNLIAVLSSYTGFDISHGHAVTSCQVARLNSLFLGGCEPAMVNTDDDRDHLHTSAWSSMMS